MRVKICGITNPEDALAAARCGADFVGVILAHSPRRVALETIRRIMAVLPASTQPVLVFRDAPLEDVLSAAQSTGCGWVQLHGREPADYLRELTSRRPRLNVIKAWEVAGPESADGLRSSLEDFSRAGATVDVVLLDAPKGQAHPGYDCLARVAERCPSRPPQVWCAGGLTPANLVAAVSAGRYDGVDVCAGVELRPGVKSHAAMLDFTQTAKRL